jgi:hypothetical protein
LVDRELTLEYNDLEGAIPFSFGSLLALESLSVDHNRLTAVPVSFLLMTSLRYTHRML